MLAEQVEQRPFGAAGEFAAPRHDDTPIPQPQPQPGFYIEPWPESERLAALQPGPDTAPRMSALEAIRAAEGDEPPAPSFMQGPPIVNPPLERPRFPVPSWRDEELERERQRTAQVEAERPQEPGLSAYPARKATT
jgi:hypothetical protein